MKLITHPPEISNPNHISVHNTLPEFWNTRLRSQNEKYTVMNGLKGLETW